MTNQQIFSPITLGNLTIKNKVVRSATFTFMPNEDGYLSDSEIDIYETLAKHHVGLLITGMLCVSQNGTFDKDGPLITEDKYVPLLHELVQKVHNYGAKIVPQINHVGARAPQKIIDVPVAPSVFEVAPGRITRALTIEEIHQIRNDFVVAALRAQEAGFDGVQVHAAHGYLLTQFISSLTNLRTDAYGGSIENRFRLLREIIEGIRAACGSAFPILVKINSNAQQDDVYETELIYMLKEMKRLGVSAVELSGYSWRSHSIQEHNYYMERAAKMRALIGIPIILVGGIRSLADMATVLAQGIDMVSLARPFIQEPQLLTNLLEVDRNAKCISCNECFTLPLTQGRRCILHALPQG